MENLVLVFSCTDLHPSQFANSTANQGTLNSNDALSHHIALYCFFTLDCIVYVTTVYEEDGQINLAMYLGGPLEESSCFTLAPTTHEVDPIVLQDCPRRP